MKCDIVMGERLHNVFYCIDQRWHSEEHPSVVDSGVSGKAVADVFYDKVGVPGSWCVTNWRRVAPIFNLILF